MTQLSDLKVGQKVIAKNSLEDGDGSDTPRHHVCRAGEELFIRKIDPNSHYPISVSHKDILDNSFGVKLEEIDAVVNK